jgi:long-chain fatty acid transport protein
VKYIKPSVVIFSFVCSFFSLTVHAAAFQLYELGTPIIGSAAVGQAVNTEDASAAFFNPAGMVYLPSTEFMLGSQIIVPLVNFGTNCDNTIEGDQGGNAGTLTPGMAIFLAYPYSQNLDFGFSVTTPYAGSLTYHDGFVGRYVVQTAFFYTINLNPSMAYRINDCFAIAGGLSLEYMNLRQTVAIPIPQQSDGQIDFRVHNYNAGFNLGFLVKPTTRTKIGLAYRSKINHNLKGDLAFLRINRVPGVTTKMVMPQNIIASFSQEFCSGFSLLAELGWSGWSSMQNTALNLQNISVVTPRNWKDTYRVGIAGHYQATPCLALQAGASYDSSPTSADHRLPDLPMDRQIRLGTGIIYAVNRSATLGFSYEYWDLGKANIHAETTTGVLSGSYTNNYSNTVQVSANILL